MKKALLAVALSIFIGLPAFWWFGRPAYRNYKESRAVTQARRFLAHKDFRNTALSARQALLINPRNVEACLLMAQMAEIAHAPQLLEWWRRIAEIAPTLNNRLRLASVALRFEEPPYPLAAETLQRVSQSAGAIPGYHLLCAELALKLNRFSEAEAHFLEAGRLEPTNDLHQLNVAVLRLRSTNDLLAADARATLERLTANSTLAPAALRSLLGDTLARRDFASAELYSSRFLADPRASFDDRLQHAAILRETKADQFESFVAELKSSAVTNAALVQALSGWMINRGLAADAFAWLTHCPAGLQEQQPVRLALADCYIANKDWAGLEAFLTDQKWGDLEFFRLALLSQAVAGQQNQIAADANWRLAVHQAPDSLGALETLLNFASTWHRDQAREDVLWRIGQKFPKERWAFRELARSYIAGGNTRGLNKLYAAMALEDPTDPLAKNNLAATCLLLKHNLPKAHQLASENYLRNPAQPVIASTYAYSLHLQGRTKEALTAFARLSPEALETPNVALYYALLLTADGQTETAAKYLAAVEQSDLLPEEKALLTEAKRPPPKDYAPHQK
jgi:hypothetical protein